MEMLVVFIVFGVALVGMIAYIRRNFKQGDGCSRCCADKGSCAGEEKRSCCS